MIFLAHEFFISQLPVTILSLKPLLLKEQIFHSDLIALYLQLSCMCGAKTTEHRLLSVPEISKGAGHCGGLLTLECCHLQV